MQSLENHNFDLLSGKAFRSLYENSTLADVTLVSEDNKMFPVHKVIISTASKVIRELLTNNRGPHHFVRLDITSLTLKAILRFIYTGKCQVEKDNIPQFMNDAKSLKITGINSKREYNPEENVLDNDETKQHDEDNDKIHPEETQNTNIVTEFREIKSCHNYDIVKSDLTERFLYTLENQIEMKKLNKIEEGELPNNKDSKKFELLTENQDLKIKYNTFICPDCGYKARDNNNLKRHMQGRACLKNKKPDNLIYYCMFCDYKTFIKYSYKRHVDIHGEAQYPCEVGDCDYKSVRKDDIKKHKEMKHFREYSTCDICGFVTHVKQYLKIHIQNKHEGKKHACEDCEKSYNTNLGLRKHRERKHQKTVFKCRYENCGYKTTIKQGHKEHIEVVHEGFRYSCGIVGCSFTSVRNQNITKHRLKKHQIEETETNALAEQVSLV